MEVKKRYLLVSPKPPPLHGETYAVQLLLKQFPRDGVEIDHLDARFVTEHADLQKISVRKVFLLFGYLFKLAVMRFRRRYDGVILTPSFFGIPFLKDSLIIWWCRLLFYRRTILWFHMNFQAFRYEEKNGLAKAFVRATIRPCRHYVCVSPRLREFLPKFMDKRKFVAIANGVPDNYNVGRAVPGSRVDVHVRYISHMHTAKGWLVLLKAAEKVCSRHSDVRFEFRGFPTAEWTAEKIEKRFRECLAPERIQYLGPLESEGKTDAFGDCDVFCFPSLNEAFPLTVLEAMSAGVPVVASNVGGIPDAVEDGTGGFTMEPDNSEALSEALEKLVTDRRLIAEMGDYNRKKFLENFTDKSYGDRWAAFLADPDKVDS